MKLARTQLIEMIREAVQKQLNEGDETPDPVGLMQSMLRDGWEAADLLRLVIVTMGQDEAQEVLEDIRDDGPESLWNRMNAGAGDSDDDMSDEVRNLIQMGR